MNKTTSEARVNVSYGEGIAILELNRPKVLNALDVPLLKEMVVKLDEINESDAKVLIITGAGRGFSAGGDVRSMLSNFDDSSFGPVFDTISAIIMKLYTMPKLVISAVSGPAAGLGFSIALSADHIIGDKSAMFAMNFIKIGLIPDGGGHFFLKKRIGDRLAKDLIWQGNNIDAENALKQGLIDEVCDKDAVDRAKELANEWLKSPILAKIETKKILSQSSKKELLEILQLEKEAQSKMRKTKDHQEGLSAFIEKRKPKFTGE